MVVCQIAGNKSENIPVQFLGTHAPHPAIEGVAQSRSGRVLESSGCLGEGAAPNCPP